MTEESAVRRRFQVSLRSLLIVTGLLALLLMPVAQWVRQREQLRRAKEEALRSFALEQLYRADLERRKAAQVESFDAGGAGVERQDPPASPEAAAQIERLQRENTELRKTIEVLRGEIQRWKSQNR